MTDPDSEAEVASPPAPGARVPDRIWVTSLCAALLALVFVGALLVRADGDPSILVHAGPEWTDPDGARGSLTVQGADDAFDGQFFYRLAVDPWSTAPTVAGVTFDLPALRNARWGYGAAAWVVSGGDPDLVPWALIAINVAAAAALGAVAGALARDSGRHALAGLLLVLWPGFAYSLSLDTSELVASTLVLGGLLAARHRRWAPAAALLAAAALTRDTTVVVPAGLAAAGAWTWWRGAPAGAPRLARDRWLGPLLAGVVPLVAFGAWQLLQRARFGELPLTSSGDNNLTAPFGGLAHQLGTMLPPDGGEEVFRLLCIGGLLALLAVAARSWRETSAPLHERFAWVPAVLVVAVLNAYLWSGATAFMRAATEAGLLSTLIVLGAPRRRLVPLVGTCLGGLWLLTAAAQLSKLG